MILLQNIRKQYGSKILYRNSTLSLMPNHRIGCIGPNGAGKTVLLRILAGEEEVDDGEVIIPGDLQCAYLPQEMNTTQSLSPLKLVLEPFKHLFDTASVAETLASSGGHESTAYRKAVHAYDALHTERAIHDADSLHARAGAILAGLGVPHDAWNVSMQRLSGGYHMRVLLAQLLLIRPDFLLLDEPTNHLDMDSLIWLEKFLERYKGGMLIVSHDRDFLTRVTTHTVEICNGTITHFTGNVNAFLSWKETHGVTEARRVKNLQDKIAQTELFINRFKAKNTKASQARSKMKQLAKLREQLPEERQIQKTVHFQLPAPQRCGSVPIQFENVTVTYDTVTVLDTMSFTVSRGDKIAVIGPNGAGKSTFLKAAFGLIQPDNGRIILGHNTVRTYYSQHRLEQLNPEKTVFDTVADSSVINDKNAIQSVLGAFLFSGDDVLKKVGVLSGGEKSRLSLATLLANPGNVLLLDEPTNHLDIESIERLTEALSRFTGTVLVVSHDEYFLSRITNRILELRPGMYRDFPGTLSDYRSYIENGYIDPLQSIPPHETSVFHAHKQERIQIRQERKRLTRRIVKIERTIAAHEQNIALLEAELSNPAHASAYAPLADIHNKLEEQKKEYDRLMEEWTTLHQQLE